MAGHLVDTDLVEAAEAALHVTKVRNLGAGGQRAVFEVDHNGHRLVMKVLAVTAAEPQTLKRAEREVRALAEMDNPHLVRMASSLVELDTPTAGAAWLEEFLDGEDLDKRVGSPWAWNDAAQLGRHVAIGVGAGHRRGIVHRDLSARNIRALDDGTYKVLDFGFARHTLLSGVTVVGQPGTPGFMSPEHLHGYSGAPTPASDIFSVGILMHLALTGELPIPWKGDDADYARRLSSATIPDLGSLRPDLEAPRVQLVRRCLHRQPARRFLNGDRLAQAFEETQ